MIVKERNLDGEIVLRQIKKEEKEDLEIDDLRFKLYEICKIIYREESYCSDRPCPNSLPLKKIIGLIPDDIKEDIQDEIDTENEAYYKVIL
jgi:hypothetical protein